jgi:hypothetical protein
LTKFEQNFTDSVDFEASAKPSRSFRILKGPKKVTTKNIKK